MKYRSEIDGLRALAVVPVLLFHAGFRAFSGGFVGVDVFFVISGYLITSILIHEFRAGDFSIGKFYERRARRILPALFLVLMACVPMAWIWLSPKDINDFSNSLIAISLFVSNFYFWLSSGYFETASELKPLIHTWSLSVEEQYYLIYPVFLWCIWRFGARVMIWVLILMLLTSLCVAQWLAYIKPIFAFYMLPTRSWELMIGGLAAIYASHINVKIDCKKMAHQIASIAGILLIIYAILFYDQTMGFPGLFALAPTIGTSLILLFATKNTLVGRVLGAQPMVWIGLISYSLYLWHQPLFAVARSIGPKEILPLDYLWLIALCFTLAYLTWKFVEQPFRSSKKISGRQVFRYTLIISMLGLATGVVCKYFSNYKNKYTVEEAIILSYENYDYKPVLREGKCFLDPEQNVESFSKDCLVNEGGGILVWGDSHAAALSYGILRLFNNVSQYTSSGCPPVTDLAIQDRPNCKAINDFVLNEIALFRPRHVVMHANWSRYGSQMVPKDLKKTIARIRAASPDTQVTVVGSVPRWDPSLPKLMIKKHAKLIPNETINNTSIPVLRSIDRQIEAEINLKGTKFLSTLAVLCQEGDCLVTTENDGAVSLVVWDDGHLTAAGSQFLVKILFNRWLDAEEKK